MRPALLLLAAACAVSCANEPALVRPQWVVTIRTDAPIPDLGDRLLVEITRADDGLACTACRRSFEASASAFPLSFGVAASAEPLRIRARLYLARDVDASGAPRAALAIDRRWDLPPEPGRIALELPLRCHGLASSANASCDAGTAQLAPIAVAPSGDGDPGMVPGAVNAGQARCGDAPPPPGMVCIDGGFFLFRDDPALSDEAARGRAQLVRVSPFDLDRDELSVGRFRALLAEGKVTEEPLLHVADGTDAEVCAYRGKDDPSADALALNCVSRTLAGAICSAADARLPRDAEWAWVAGNGGRGTDFTWGAAGSSSDICAHAVVGRGRILETPSSTIAAHYDCRIARADLTYAFGPLPAARAGDEGDVALGVRGLAGNLAEWVADDWAPVGDPCWSTRPWLVDPKCTTTAHTPTLRGGSWADAPFAARSTIRGGASGAPIATNGFRCARSR